MKTILKRFLVALVLLSATSAVNAQAGRPVDQAKLPSNRPMPDPRILQRKIEFMRAHASKQNAQIRQESLMSPVQRGTNPTLNRYPNDIQRATQKRSIN